MKKLGAMLLVAVLTGVIATGMTLWFTGYSNSSTQSTAMISVPAQRASTHGMNMESLDFTVPAERTVPVVVHIRATKMSEPTAGGFGGMDVPAPFRDFFGPQMRGGQPQQPREQQGSGSGVIISPDGYIVSNNHVVGGAEKLEVTLNNNETYEAEIVGTDPNTDIAVIKIKPNGELPFIRFANSDALKIGEWVVAVGNPFNLSSTVTAGIVSAKGRNINIMEGQAPIEAFIQTDAAINPGNSGGALVDLSGNLVGINTAIATPTGVYAGYGFAVPSNIVSKIVGDLKEFGVVQRAYLGVMIRNVDASLVKEEGLDVSNGVFVSEVNDDSSADDAGVQAKDVILEVDGKATKTTPELIEFIGRKRPGDQTILTILRDGRTLELPVTLKNSSGNTDAVAKNDRATLPDILGADFEDISSEELADLDASAGVKVSKLRNGKLTAQTAIREGFIITHVDKKPVRSAEELLRTLEKRDGGVLLEGVYPGSHRTYYYAFGM